MTFRRSILLSVACAGLALVLQSCGGGGSGAPKNGAGQNEGDPAVGGADADAGAAPVSKEPPGSIDLVVTYAGAAAAGEELPVDIDVEFCAKKVFAEGLIVDASSKGLKNAVLKLEKVRGPRKKPDTIKVVNRNCGFSEHVTVAVKGSKMLIENQDPVLHTTHPYIDGKSFFNASISKGDKLPPRPIPKAGLMKVKCDVHSWMEAWVVVHDNPYVAVTDAQGKLNLDQVPPGTHNYTLWHETLGEQKGQVVVQSNQATELKLEYAAK